MSKDESGRRLSQNNNSNNNKNRQPPNHMDYGKMLSLTLREDTKVLSSGTKCYSRGSGFTFWTRIVLKVLQVILMLINGLEIIA